MSAVAGLPDRAYFTVQAVIDKCQFDQKAAQRELRYSLEEIGEFPARFLRHDIIDVHLMKLGVRVRSKGNRAEYKPYVRIGVCGHTSEVTSVLRGQIRDVPGMPGTVCQAREIFCGRKCKCGLFRFRMREPLFRETVQV